MHFHGSKLFALAIIADTASALRVLPLGFTKPKASALRRRAGTYSSTLANNVSEGTYIATVQVGTPPQEIQIAIDTGSSDVWLLDTNTNLCTNQRMQEEFGPCLTPFDSSKSSTYKLVAKGTFQAQYADGTGAEGNYFTDNLSIGGANVTDFQMGLATESQLPMGLLGIGFDTNEANRGGSIYPNLIDVLVSSGQIGVKAYSLYLNDIESATGTILFGGLDTGKYIGSLKAVPMEPNEAGQYIDFTVALSSISGSFSGNSTTYSNQTTAAILDSGTTLIYLPSDSANTLFSQFNAYDDTQSSGLVYVSCNYLSSASSFTFDFQFGGSDGPLIKIPIDEIIQNDVQPLVSEGALELPPDLPFPADQACSFGIQGADGAQGLYLLGDTFLRSAYVVYDLQNRQIALAQANFNSTETHIIEMSGSSGIPSVSGVASQVTVVQSATGLPGPGRQTSAGPELSGTGGGGGEATVTVTAGATSKSAAGAGPPAASFEALAVAGIAGIFALLGGAMIIL